MDESKHIQENSVEESSFTRTPKKAKKKSWLRDIISVLFWAIIIAAVVKCFIVDSRVIPSSSMSPTIETGDRVVMSRLSYIGDKEPQCGDIVVFRPPAELHEKSDLIKRIIGRPGDTVEIKNGSVYINGTVLEEDYLAEPPAYEYGPVVVPADCYFVLGDNRNNSLDAHLWSDPFISIDNIKGKAVCRYWPFDRIGAIY